LSWASQVDADIYIEEETAAESAAKKKTDAKTMSPVKVVTAKQLES